MTNPYLPDPMIEIGPDGTPRSGVSGDVYFSKHGGIAESRYVFLGGIGAPEVWNARSHYRIGELGFGTGLNFLVTWHEWKKSAPADAQLDYMAVEGYPIPIATLSTILRRVPELAHEADALLGQWPPRVGGVHRLHLEGGRVRLTLLFGEAQVMLTDHDGQVDAWYLDGFAPSRNPDMWTPGVLAEVARLSGPGARLATFSAAGAVRRGLADLGFNVHKRDGFAHKRDCVTASLDGDLPALVLPNVAVIGAGIAGGAIARALGQRGMKITLIDKADAPGSAASGNPAALLAPRLPRERTPLGRIMAQSYLYAVRYYDRLAAEGAEVWLGARGGLALARNASEAERQSRAVAAFGWPDDIMRLVDADESTALAGIEVASGGLWFSRAGTLNPSAITAHLAAGAAYLQADVGDMIRETGQWLLKTPDGNEIGMFDIVVLAAGVGVLRLMGAQPWPLRANRGQLAYLPALNPGPKVPVTYGGYLSPVVDLPEIGKGHVLGATYARRDEVPDRDWEALRPEDEAHMRSVLEEHLPSVQAETAIGGRTALRATIRDYIPLAGAAGDDFYVLGGLGSRGFLTAPLLAELIADRLTGAPLPLEASLVRALDPSRFSVS
ncbi:FAD-dependent 5-carboxymethylaminomethyl-2-thiouridine(34) oxidoreductase MnmC [Thalassospiraceae bacterium LMO-JJ14]|nr:FAD-dependent 5-carboxymethylaminomethyl-2-thiouridine(34) oxidoreductase MnmC [Thalassospiraceae bacterium LMO-JJ14]